MPSSSTSSAPVPDSVPPANAAPGAGPPDDVVVAEVRRGNREMFEVLVRRHNARLFRTGLAYLRDAAAAEDAMQNAYVKAFLHLDRFEGTAAFATWLTRILINECLLILRRRRAKAEEPFGAEAEDALEAAAARGGRSDGAACATSLKEMKTLLEQAIHSLPRGYRAVYVLREVQQLSTAETAACLGLRAGSVKVRLHRAREQLKERLLKTAAGVELFTFTAERCDPLTARVIRAVLATTAG